MNRFSYWMLALIGAISVGLISSTSISRAADGSASTGSITGKVVDSSGNAVGGAMVRLIEIPANMQQGHHHRPPKLQPGETRWMTIGMTTTADDGTFTVNNAPAGKYRVIVFSRDAGRGFVRKPVEVTAGGTADAGTITLKNGGRHGHGRRHKGNGPPPPPGGN